MYSGHVKIPFRLYGFGYNVYNNTRAAFCDDCGHEDRDLKTVPYRVVDVALPVTGISYHCKAAGCIRILLPPVPNG